MIYLRIQNLVVFKIVYKFIYVDHILKSIKCAIGEHASQCDACKGSLS